MGIFGMILRILGIDFGKERGPFRRPISFMGHQTRGFRQDSKSAIRLCFGTTAKTCAASIVGTMLSDQGDG